MSHVRHRTRAKAMLQPCFRILGLALGAILVIDGDTVEQEGVRWRLVGIDAAWAEIAIAKGHAVAWDGTSNQPSWCPAVS
jgi:hypothetical protein